MHNVPLAPLLCNMQGTKTSCWCVNLLCVYVCTVHMYTIEYLFHFCLRESWQPSAFLDQFKHVFKVVVIVNIISIIISILWLLSLFISQWHTHTHTTKKGSKRYRKREWWKEVEEAPTDSVRRKFVCLDKEQWKVGKTHQNECEFLRNVSPLFVYLCWQCMHDDALSLFNITKCVCAYFCVQENRWICHSHWSLISVLWCAILLPLPSSSAASSSLGIISGV